MPVKAGNELPHSEDIINLFITVYARHVTFTRLSVHTLRYVQLVRVVLLDCQLFILLFRDARRSRSDASQTSPPFQKQTSL